MTTIITTRYPTRRDSAAIYMFGPDRVDFGITQADENERAVAMDRAEFLAAVSAELGVLIINRDDLPKVKEDGNRYEVDGETFWGGVPDYWKGTRADLARAFALRDLALAEYLAANPPVDEDQVNALADLIIEADGTSSVTQKLAIRDVARRLVRAGVRAPEETGR